MDEDRQGTPERPLDTGLDGGPAKRRIAKSLSELGEAMGVSKARAGQLSKEPWFPVRGAEGWAVDEVLRLRRERELALAGRGPPASAPESPQAPTPAPIAAPAPAPPPPVASPDNPLLRAREALVAAAAARVATVTAEDAEIVERLKASTDPLEVARLAAQLAARQYARDLDDESAKTLHGSLETWRKMENDVLELASRRGEVIERDAAKACVGAFGQRFKLACDRLASRLASQVEMWRTEEVLWARPLEERARVFREWALAQTAQARLAELGPEAAAEVELMVATELEARAKVRSRRRSSA